MQGDPVFEPHFSASAARIGVVPAVPAMGTAGRSEAQSFRLRAVAAYFPGFALLAGLIWFSLHLAASRIYQVDECMEVYVARMLATGQAQSFAGHVTLFQVILAWFVRNATRSMDLFASARFVMIEVFWLNLVLLALATGEKLLSRRGLIALLAAATLAPLWDYGF